MIATTWPYLTGPKRERPKISFFSYKDRFVLKIKTDSVTVSFNRNLLVDYLTKFSHEGRKEETGLSAPSYLVCARDLSEAQCMSYTKQGQK